MLFDSRLEHALTHLLQRLSALVSTIPEEASTSPVRSSLRCTFEDEFRLSGISSTFITGAHELDLSRLSSALELFDVLWLVKFGSLPDYFILKFLLALLVFFEFESAVVKGLYLMLHIEYLLA